MQSYAVAWADPTAKVCTRTDRVGGESPTWNDRFIFRVPAAFLHPDSPSSVSVEIYAAGGWCIPDSLVGTVRLLVGNHRLLDRPPGIPPSAVGIRRPSGRFDGVLNIGATILSRVSALTEEALAGSPAVGYRDLTGQVPRTWAAAKRRRWDAGTDPALKELNGESKRWSDGGEGVHRSDGRGTLCGMGLPSRIHLSPSNQNLQALWSNEGRARDGRP